MTRLHALPALCALAGASLLTVACGDDDAPPPVDAGPIIVDAGDPDAGAPDAGPPPPSYLFGPCVADSQCPGPDAVCRTAAEDGYLGGYCTAPCADRGVCDDGVIYNHCIELRAGEGMQCEKRCLNGADCSGFRPNYTCLDQDAPLGGVCIGVCSDAEQCAPDADCNLWSGLCVPPGTVVDGAQTGEACADDPDCRSENCVTERSTTGGPTGWLDGYCMGPCILPSGYNSSTFFMGDALPAGTCTGDAICFPNGSLGRNDLGVCLDACTADAECRSGYGCRRQFRITSGTASYSNGVCLPIDCSSTACPTGFTCARISTTSGPRDVCSRT